VRICDKSAGYFPQRGIWWIICFSAEKKYNRKNIYNKNIIMNHMRIRSTRVVEWPKWVLGRFCGGEKWIFFAASVCFCFLDLPDGRKTSTHLLTEIIWVERERKGETHAEFIQVGVAWTKTNWSWTGLFCAWIDLFGVWLGLFCAQMVLSVRKWISLVRNYFFLVCD